MKRTALFPIGFALFLISIYRLPAGHAQGLPFNTTSLFAGSGVCADCHTTDGTALRDSQGNDLSPPTDWRSTMMANSAKDPFWQAKVEAEVTANPQLKAVIEDKCTTCHAPMGRTQAVYDGASGYTLDAMRKDPLAMDGVSCTVCHQIQPDNLGSKESFSGKYIITDKRQIFGPYQNVLTAPMINNVNYTPLFGAHMQKSELCATCHTLFTPYLDDEGNIAGEFPEQTPYLEWKNSDFYQKNIQCQDCHMPLVDEAVKIANRPRMLGTQQPFWRHIFVGGNTFMLSILRDFGTEIGVTATKDQFDATIAATRQQLQERTVKMTANARVENDTLKLDVELANLTGHKFPSGYPARRAWLHVLVKTADGKTVFESGAYDENGVIIGEGAFTPHFNIITSPEQVQIYEAVMQDVNGAVTHTLLRAASYKKDNRIPPTGFTSQSPDYADIAIAGKAADDPDFNRRDGVEGYGSDVVHYQIALSGVSGKLDIQVDFLYQSIKPQFVNDLFQYNTPAVNRFKGYYQNADKTPERVQSASLSVDVPTGVETPGQQLPEGFALLNNYPNPFIQQTTIEFQLTRPLEVFAAVYDIRGRLVRTLVAGQQPAGYHRIAWDGRDDSGRRVGSGVYIIKLNTPGRSIAHKILKVR